ncbi:unnamed protein product [Rotaria sp. Silwood1]|nr:unnamed protein product [Rotaria sp. Silwood1]
MYQIQTDLFNPHYVRFGDDFSKFLPTFIEYILNESNLNALFHALEVYFSKVYDLQYFVFGHGIGVGSYKLVKRYIQDIPPCNGFESWDWKVSSSQETRHIPKPPLNLSNNLDGIWSLTA